MVGRVIIWIITGIIMGIPTVTTTRPTMTIRPA
jgi:hypothetical protein